MNTNDTLINASTGALIGFCEVGLLPLDALKIKKQTLRPFLCRPPMLARIFADFKRYVIVHHNMKPSKGLIT